MQFYYNLNVCCVFNSAEAAGYTRDIVLKMKDKENNTALHSAVNSGSEEAVRVCIEFGSPIDVLQVRKARAPFQMSCSCRVQFK